jgi:hypothetical protein
MKEGYGIAKTRKRLDDERVMAICARCCRRVRCQIFEYYCPPYTIAAQWWYVNYCVPRYDMEKSKEMIQDFKEIRRKEKFDIPRFCNLCVYNWKGSRCALTKEEFKEKPYGLWLRKVCRALAYIHTHIPCGT